MYVMSRAIVRAPSPNSRDRLMALGRELDRIAWSVAMNRFSGGLVAWYTA